MSYGDICWAGYYCPNGTASPEPCPSGTFSDIQGLGDESECVSCSPGMKGVKKIVVLLPDIFSI